MNPNSCNTCNTLLQKMLHLRTSNLSVRSLGNTCNTYLYIYKLNKYKYRDTEYNRGVKSTKVKLTSKSVTVFISASNFNIWVIQALHFLIRKCYRCYNSVTSPILPKFDFAGGVFS